MLQYNMPPKAKQGFWDLTFDNNRISAITENTNQFTIRRFVWNAIYGPILLDIYEMLPWLHGGINNVAEGDMD